MKKLFAVDDSGVEAYWKLFRKYHNTRSEFIKTLINQRWKKLMLKFGACVPLNAKTHRSVLFPHGLHGVFISLGAEIGENTTVFKQVTIGSNTLLDSVRYGAPVIGSNCYIGAGAKIIGAVHIGDDARIGANCVVVKDVPAHATVVLAQPRMILHEESRDNRYMARNKQNR